jgi:lipoprotein-anchoring transpeptidase ErfK/SrfK
MRSKSFVLVAGFLVLLCVGAGAVFAYDNSKKDTIAEGVTVAGIDVGGMNADQARATLQRRLMRGLKRPVVVKTKSRRYVLTAKRAHVGVDVRGTVEEALRRSRQGDIVSRTYRNLSGNRLDVVLQPTVVYSSTAVKRLVERVRHDVDRNPVEADAVFGPAGPSIRPGQAGRKLARVRLRRAVEAALAMPGAARFVRAYAKTIKPTRTTAEVVQKYPTMLVIDRTNFQLRLYRHLKLAKSYTVAVGQQGLETPAGLYHIQNKAVDPSWHVPNSAWAGADAGKIVPPGPDNPIKARWLGIFAGAGIHGTDETYSLGHAASHGCVRMAIPDVIELYPQVSVGAPIYIA